VGDGFQPLLEYQQLSDASGIVQNETPPFLPSPQGEKREQQFVFYSNITMATLTGAVGDTCEPPFLTGGQGQTRVVLVGDAGWVTYSLSLRLFGTVVWEVAMDLRIMDFECPGAEVSHLLTGRVMKRATPEPARGGCDQTLTHPLCPGCLCCALHYRQVQGSGRPRIFS